MIYANTSSSVLAKHITDMEKKKKNHLITLRKTHSLSVRLYRSRVARYYFTIYVAIIPILRPVPFPYAIRLYNFMIWLGWATTCLQLEKCVYSNIVIYNNFYFSLFPSHFYWVLFIHDVIWLKPVERFLWVTRLARKCF